MRASLLLTFLCLVCFGAIAQSETEPVFEEPQFYQLYLDEEVDEIIKIEYKEDGEELEFELGKDKKTVYLKNYYKEKHVIITTRDKAGEKAEILRTKCHIDPVIPS